MSGEKGGKDLLLKIETSTPGTYATLGSLRAKTMSINAEEIDVTNHESNQLKTLLDGAGIVSFALSGSGIHNGDSSTLNRAEDRCRSQSLTNFQIVDANGRTYQGLFKIVTFERTGEYNGAQTYSISLSSSGDFAVI